jgi:hypothetical protein
MNFPSAFAIACAIACIPVALALTARWLVPARVAVRGYWVTSAIIAAALAPLLLALELGASWWVWCFGLVGLAPYAAGLYLRGRAHALGGAPLGLRAASELSLWTVCVAVATGVALWGWAHAR